MLNHATTPQDRLIGSIALSSFILVLFSSLMVNAATSGGGRISVSPSSPQAVVMMAAADR